MEQAAQPLWSRSPRLVVLLWLLGSSLLAIFGFATGFDTVIPGPASRDALLRNPGERVALQGGMKLRDVLTVIVHHPTLQIEAPPFKKLRDEVVSDLRGWKGAQSGHPLFEKVQTVGYAPIQDLDSLFYSEDRHSLLLQAPTFVTLDEAGDELAQVPHLVEDLRRKYPTFSFWYLSQGTSDNETFELIHRDLDRSLVYTIPITLLILLWAFGSVGAALIPLFMALVSLVTSLGVAALLSHPFGPVSATANQLVVLLVLAIGVDYSLFIVNRVREEVRRGASYVDSIRSARAHTCVAVFWSGLTVAISLVGLLLMNDTILTSMALVSIAAVVVTSGGIIWTLPSLLLLMGTRLEWGRLTRPTARASHDTPGWWLGLSLRRPIAVMTCGLFVILLVSAFSFRLKLGNTFEPQLLPQALQSTAAFARLEESFPKFSGADFSLVMRAPRLEDLDDDGALQPFMTKLLTFPQVKGPTQIDRSEDRTVARYEFFAAGSTNRKDNIRLIEHLRTELIPRFLTPLGVEAFVSGTLPYVADENQQYLSRTPLVFAVVLLLSVAFLLVAFRSLVVPVKAVILNLLSTGAAFGTMVLLFQISGLPGWSFGVIESFVPALLFAILFGLSMDYHVVMLSRVAEEVARGETTHEAISRGITETSGAITSAAAIMVSVFAVIASLELPVMKQLGVGLAVAVFIDATIIRTMLLPASMVLLGKWNWYFPDCLRWLPRVRI